MPAFCDVALPVPLDQTFTYSLGGAVPVVGARVLVPFAGQRLMGVVTRLHDDALPDGIETKSVQQVLDSTAILTDELMRLAAWIATYYVAPLGEVLRGMLPLAAEVKRHFVYRIAEPGRKVLYQGAKKAAPAGPASRPSSKTASTPSSTISKTEPSPRPPPSAPQPRPTSPSSTAWSKRSGSSAKPSLRSATPAASNASPC